MSDKTIQERFEEFHDRHPEVYSRLIALARLAKERGRDRWAIGNLWEIVRWETYIVKHPEDGEFKLNDHYRSRYARLIMEQEDDLDGFFEVRELRAA